MFKIVWCQYANVASQNLLDKLSQDQDSTNAAAKSAHLRPILLPPVSDDVASTIVDILILLGQEEGLLDAFWPGLQTSCVGILLDKSSENGPRLARLGDFFSLLHEKMPEKEIRNNSWLLRNVVQPFVVKGFPAIRQSVSFLLFLSIVILLFQEVSPKSRTWFTSKVLFSESVLFACSVILMLIFTSFFCVLL